MPSKETLEIVEAIPHHDLWTAGDMIVLQEKLNAFAAEARAQERERAIRAVKNACWREEITAKAASIIISELAEPQEQT